LIAESLHVHVHVQIPSQRRTVKISILMSSESHQMPGVKRSHDGNEKENESSGSPFMPMFERFRDELDEHHDRRERIIKASRDITAASKKM
jgi:hypothetical protein